MSIIQWTPEQLKQGMDENQDLILLDVREQHEFDYAHINGSVLIPLGKLPEAYRELDAEKQFALICHHGMRSQQACLFLQQQGFSRLYNLKGGIDAWSLVCDPSIRRY